MKEYDKKEREKGGAERKQEDSISGSSLSIKTTLDHKEVQRLKTKKMTKQLFCRNKWIYYVVLVIAKSMRQLNAKLSEANRKCSVFLKDTERER